MTQFEQWIADYPRHCPACLGSGKYNFYGSRELPGLISAPCQCVHQGQCPRCRSSILQRKSAGFESYSKECRFCGWNGIQSAAPVPPEMEINPQGGQLNTTPDSFYCPNCGRGFQIDGQPCKGCNEVFRLNTAENSLLELGEQTADSDLALIEDGAE